MFSLCTNYLVEVVKINNDTHKRTIFVESIAVPNVLNRSLT